ncbi:hypothetical protein J7F03_40455 [Streptomyces sp. ISL-43]|uniref:hypothetical protein n=1 Tax=Streptomyces sp. ISL-43 TaxID=2819183 RepID=UPI001BEBF3DF|nr:hypothetical protein [Streptomyces sp. ISL-43]MBT2453178.1 hypothetical protein [Streptomyces sp. ISL-43]
MSPTVPTCAGMTSAAWTTWSRAVWTAIVKQQQQQQQRSGSVPARDSAASTLTVRSTW